MRSYHLVMPIACALCSCAGTADGANETQNTAKETAAMSEPVTANIILDADWGTGYCVRLYVTNNGASATTSWTATLNVGSANLISQYGGNFIRSNSTLSISSATFNSVIAPGATMHAPAGFCAQKTPSTPTATVVSATGTH